jgi:hypothetical protein
VCSVTDFSTKLCVHSSDRLSGPDGMHRKGFRSSKIRMRTRQGNVRVNVTLSYFGALEVVCWPLVPKFAGSNPAEAVGFFREKKILSTPSTEGK